MAFTLAGANKHRHNTKNYSAALKKCRLLKKRYHSLKKQPVFKKATLFFLGNTVYLLLNYLL